MNMYHIRAAEGAMHSRKQAGCYNRPAFSIPGPYRMQRYTLMGFERYRSIKFCSGNMVATPVIANHVVAHCRHAGTEFFHNNFNAAFPGRNALMTEHGNIQLLFLFLHNALHRRYFQTQP